MLLTVVKSPDRTSRLYATRCASVVCFFTESEDGGVALITEQGSGATLWDYEATARDVRADVLQYVAARMKVDASEVLKARYSDLTKIADPDLAEEYRFARRDNRAFPRRF